MDNIQPNPRNTMRALLYDESWVDRNRNINCPKYEDCLDIACAANMQSFTCKACNGFAFYRGDA